MHKLNSYGRGRRHRKALESDYFFYGRVTVADMPKIVDGLDKAQPVELLVVPAE